MACAVCTEPSNYKCPACKAPYCSITCFKTHKETCLPPAITASPAPAAPAPVESIPKNAQYEKWLEDPQIAYLLKQSGLKHHLRVIAQIAEDAKMSGESTSEGRRYVAVKKLRELRIGGREQNEVVEEFVSAVLQQKEGGA